jgi:HD superfamily phosphohydrolase
MTTIINTPTEKAAIVALKKEVDDFVSHHLPEKSDFPKSPTVVHDGLWGTLVLKPVEVAFINTPLFQRLRLIRQTGNAFFTYPSTSHTRFEHMLGVVLQADKLGNALLENTNVASKFSSPDVEHMRLAGLFHDLGHGPFSHTSEEIYGGLTSIIALKKNKKFRAASPHEILTYLILTSKRFRKFCDEVGHHYDEEIPLEEIAGYVVGHDVHKRKTFKREILNGPFDCDKLDYLFRDSHFSGLPLAVDIDRLFHTVHVHDVKKTPRLVVAHSGATALVHCKY